MQLSVVINTKNAAATLPAALRSVQNLADEVIAVDMKSTDGTPEIAKKLGAIVFTYPEDLGFADPARNFALSKAHGDWLLVLDADEEVSPGLRALLQRIMSGTVAPELTGECYAIARQNIIFGYAFRHTGWWPDFQLRFFKKGTVQWTEKVHTQPVATSKVIHLPADPQVAFIHQNYQTVQQFIERLNRYTNLVHLQKNSAPAPEKTLTADHFVRKFSAEFFRRFFAEHGYEDGLHGLNLSLLQSFYEFTALLKLWEKTDFAENSSQNPQEMMSALHTFQKDLAYWLADWHVQHSVGVSKLLWQLRRKFSRF